MANSILKKTYVAMTQAAYSAASAIEEFKSHIVKLPDNFKVLAKSTDLTVTGQHNLRAIAFIDNEAKKVVIACAGTDPNSLNDLYDDYKLFKGQTPLKIKAIKAFIDLVTLKLGADAASYSFDMTGHSLGAVVADLAAIDLKGKGYNVESCITFDNPGTHAAYNYAVKEKMLASLTPDELMQTEFVAYQARPNAINTANKQIGEVRLLIGGDIVAPIKIENNEIDSAPSLGIKSYVQNLIGKVGKVAYNSLSTAHAKSIYNTIISWSDASMLEVYKKQMSDLGNGLSEVINNKDTHINELIKTATEIKAASTAVYAGLPSIFSLPADTSVLSALSTITRGAMEGYKLVKKVPELYNKLSTLYEVLTKLYELASRVSEHQLYNFDAVFTSEGNDAGFKVSSGYSFKDKYVAAHAPCETNKPGFFSKLKTYMNNCTTNIAAKRLEEQKAQALLAEKSMISKIWLQAKGIYKITSKFLDSKKDASYEIEFKNAEGDESVFIPTAAHLKSFLATLKNTVEEAAEQTLDLNFDGSLYNEILLSSFDVIVTGENHVS